MMFIWAVYDGCMAENRGLGGEDGQCKWVGEGRDQPGCRGLLFGRTGLFVGACGEIAGCWRQHVASPAGCRAAQTRRSWAAWGLGEGGAGRRGKGPDKFT